MKKKLFILFLSVISFICLAVGLSACGGNSENSSGSSDHEHSLIYYSAVDATETEDGHKEYWYCVGCGKYFSDSEGKNEIDVNSIIIAALGENTTYTITFIADNNIISEVSYSKGNTNIEIPEVPAKYGYEGVWSDFELYTGNITVVAVYTPVDCYVNYENTKGTYNSNVSIYTIENGITLNDLYLDGYTFNGWYTEDGEKITEISYNNYSSGITLVADWSLIEYTATFVDENGDTVATRSYTVETEYISVPEVPEKSGYAGAWESYNLTIGGITVTPVYTVNAYTATFVDENGDAIYYSTYTVENDSIHEPSVPYKQGYTGVWQSYSLDIGGITISPVYTAIKYNVIFVADDETVDTVTYTVEDETITEPQIPTKEGLDGEWEDYTLTYGVDITVTALYTTEGATEGLVYAYADGYYSVTNYIGSDTEILIPNLYKNFDVTSISDNAFNSCTVITSVYISDGITFIGNSAFAYCEKLTNISISSDMNFINELAFYDCISLANVYINDLTAWFNISFGYSNSNPLVYGGSLNVYNSASESYELLTDLVVPDDITAINAYVFCGCSSIKSVTIPSNITYIGNYAFYNCSAIENIIISSGIETIGACAFLGCSSLISITLPFIGSSAEDADYTYFGYLFGTYYYNTSSPYNYIPSSLITVVLTGGSSIADYAFYNCTSLVNISISDSIMAIGSYAFYNCNSLTSVTV